MSTPEPMNIDQAVEAMIQPEEQPVEEVVEETESESESEVTDELDEEQPEADSEDEGEEVEDESDYESEDEDDSEDEDNEDEVDESEDEDPDKALYTVKVDGVEEQVTLDDLKRGYSGQKYVQKGMQEAAEARKQAEEVYTSLLQERQKIVEMYNGLQQGQLQPPVEPDIADYDADPIAYIDAEAKYKKDLRAYNQQMEVVQQQLAAQSEAEARARQAYFEEEGRKLVQALPELKDEKAMDQFWGKISNTAKQFGYTDAELQQVTSHRDMMVLHYATIGMKMQENQKIVQQKSKKARKPLKSKATKVVTKSEAARKQRDKLRQSGSDQDFLALMLNPDLK